MPHILGSNKIYFLLSVLLLISSGLANDNSDNVLDERNCPKNQFISLPFWVEKLDPTIFDIITELLPEGQACASNLLTKSQHFTFNEDNTYMNVTYIFSNTSSRNLFGYFIYNRSGDRTLQKHVIWPYLPNQKDENLNCVSLGDSVTIGPFNKTDSVGFWFQHIYQTINNSYYSFLDPPYITNPDDSVHLVWARLEHVNLTLFGFEDAHLLGDHDYNDIIWTVETTPSTEMIGINICGRDCLAVCRDIGQILYSSYVTYKNYVWGLLDYGKSEISSYILIPNGWKIASKSDMTDELIKNYGHLWTYFHPDPCIAIADSGTLRGYTINNTLCDSDSFEAINKYHPDCYTTNYQTRILLYKPASGLEFVLNVPCEKNTTKFVQKIPELFADRLLNPVYYDVKIFSFDNVILKSSFLPYNFGSLVADIIFLVDTVNIDYKDKLEIKKSASFVIDLFESNGFLRSDIVSGIKISFAYYTGESNGDRACDIKSEYKMHLTQDNVDKQLEVLDHINPIKQEEPTDIICAVVNTLQNVYSAGYGFKIVVILTSNSFRSDVNLVEVQRNSNYAILIFNPSAEPNSSWIELAATIVKPLYLGAVAFRKEKDYTESIWENVFLHTIDPVIAVMTRIVPFSTSEHIQILSEVSHVDLKNPAPYDLEYSVSIPSDIEYYNAEVMVAGYGKTSVHISKIPLPVAESFSLRGYIFSSIEFAIRNPEPLADASIYKIFTLPDPECCTLNFNNEPIERGAEFELNTTLSIISKGTVCKTYFNYSFFNNCTFGNIAMVNIEYYKPDLTIKAHDLIQKIRLSSFNPENNTIYLKLEDYLDIDFHDVNQEISPIRINITVPPNFSECGELFDSSSLKTHFTGGIVQDRILFIPNKQFGKHECSFEYQALHLFNESNKASVTFEVSCAAFPPVIEIANTHLHKISTDSVEIPISITDDDGLYMDEYVDLFASSENAMSQLIYYKQETDTFPSGKLISGIQIPENGIKLNLTWASKEEEYEEVEFTIYAVDTDRLKSNTITLHLIAHPRSDPVIDFYPKYNQITSIGTPYLLTFGATSVYDLESLEFKLPQLPDTGEVRFYETGVEIEANKYYGKETSLSYISGSNPPRLMIDISYTPTVCCKEESISLVARDIHGFESAQINSTLKYIEPMQAVFTAESTSRIFSLANDHSSTIDIPIKINNQLDCDNIVMRLIDIKTNCFVYANNGSMYLKNYTHNNELGPLELTCNPNTKAVTLDILCHVPLDVTFGTTGHIIYTLCSEDGTCTKDIVTSVEVSSFVGYENISATVMQNEVAEIYLPIYGKCEGIPANQKETVYVVSASDNLFFTDTTLTQPITNTDHQIIKYPFVVYFSSLKSNTENASISTAELIYTYTYTTITESFISPNFHFKMPIKEKEDPNFEVKDGIRIFTPKLDKYETKNISLNISAINYFDLSNILGINSYSDQVYIKIVSLPFFGRLCTCVYKLTCNDPLKPKEIPYIIIGTPTYLRYDFIPYSTTDSDSFELVTYTYDGEIDAFINVSFNLDFMYVVPKISSIISSIKETPFNRYTVPVGSNITFDWTVINPTSQIFDCTTQISLRVYSMGAWKLYHCYYDSNLREDCNFKEISNEKQLSLSSEILVKPSYGFEDHRASDVKLNWWEAQNNMSQQRIHIPGFRIRLFNQASNKNGIFMKISLQAKNTYNQSKKTDLFILSTDIDSSITT
ncbi:uncharacterized protein LOC126315280 [Schistocerca gregaria]|uniref:uncharacterized protein LOC126315280 n=1 Tax=Schistocerca gregaria TaxID=7010 RepID=UPI00211DC690|nr:uncharacterized protein LOC126315280 [Schistocerca gregaria]